MSVDLDFRIYTPSNSPCGKPQANISSILNKKRPNYDTGSYAPYAYGGVDWAKYGQNKSYEFMIHYTHHNMEELHRSVFPGVPKTRWNGYGADSAWFRPTLWCWLFNGDTGLGNFVLRGVFKPDFEPTANQDTMREIVIPLQQGLAKLIMEVRGNLYNDLALHLSQSSIQGTHAISELSDNDLNENRESWIEAFRSCGCTLEWCAGTQVERGKLMEKKYGALFMLLSVAISDAEAKELEKYVEAGGIVIADPFVGLMDEHCKMRNSAVIEKLFGIKRNRPGWKNQTVTGAISFGNASRAPVWTGLNLETTVYDSGLTATAGTVMAKIRSVPAIIVRRHGKGCAVIVNTKLTDYNKLKKDCLHGAYLQFIYGLLGNLGIPRMTCVESENAGPPDVYAFQFHNGLQRIIGLVHYDWEKPTPPRVVKVTLPEPKHAYEVEKGVYLGKISELKASIPIGHHALWMLSPEPIEKLMVNGPKSVNSGEKVSFSLELVPVQEDTRSILRVEVTGPDGCQRPWYASNVVAIGGQAEYAFPTALNDQPGTWKIHVRDVASGIQVENFFQVK